MKKRIIYVSLLLSLLFTSTTYAQLSTQSIFFKVYSSNTLKEKTTVTVQQNTKTFAPKTNAPLPPQSLPVRVILQSITFNKQAQPIMQILFNTMNEQKTHSVQVPNIVYRAQLTSALSQSIPIALVHSEMKRNGYKTVTSRTIIVKRGVKGYTIKPNERGTITVYTGMYTVKGYVIFADRNGREYKRPLVGELAPAKATIQFSDKQLN